MHTLSALAVLAACSGAPLPTDLERAQSLERTGDDTRALDAWHTIAAACHGPGARPHDDCGLAAMREAQLYERLGRDRDAATAWESLPRHTVDARKAARGLARAAEIHLEKLDDTPGALALAWLCVTRYPDEAPADDALALAVRVERKTDPAALRARLDALAESLRKTDLDDNLLFAAADLSLELGDRAGAVARWDELVRRAPHSSLYDDACWRAAVELRLAGDPAGALARLERILRTRRDALLVGSYNAPLLDDAQLLVGVLRRDDLHDDARAIEAFEKLADDYPDSTLRDDALYELARTYLHRHTPSSDEDRALACAAIARCQTRFPDGNRTRAVRELGQRTGCPAR